MEVAHAGPWEASLTEGALPSAFFSELLSPEDAQALRQLAPQADLIGALQPAQVALLHERGWLTLLAPVGLGGAEWPLPRLVRLQEALAAADPNVAWVVTLCSGASWFAGFWPEAMARRLMATPRLCVAGNGAPGGVAERDGSGWRLNGRWQHATGADLATHFTFNAELRQGGEPLREASGQPQVRTFIVEAAQVQVEPSWRSLGLRATSTHAFSVTDARVPEDHAFDLRADAATASGPLYRVPFVTLAWVTLAINLCGMARAFLAQAQALRRARERPALQQRIDTAVQALAMQREDFYLHLEAAWAEWARGRNLDEADGQALQGCAAVLVQTARRAVDSVYPVCGLQATQSDQALNRLWRDLHTASQHGLFTP